MAPSFLKRLRCVLLHSASHASAPGPGTRLAGDRDRGQPFARDFWRPVPADRSAFLVALAQLLRNEPNIGDGTVSRAIRSLQREFWRPPQIPGGNPLPALRMGQANKPATPPRPENDAAGGHEHGVVT